MQSSMSEVRKPQSGPLSRVDLRAYAIVAALAIIWIFFLVMTNGAYLTPRNLSNLAVQMAVTAILTCGMSMLIVGGQVDLSAGSLLGLTGGIAAILEVWQHWPTWAAMLAAVAAGALLGMLNGWVVAYGKVPAFIVTLGGMMLFRGLLLAVSSSKTVAGLTPAFRYAGQGFLPKPLGWGLALLAVGLTVYGLIRQRQGRVKYGFPVPSPLMFSATLLLYAAGILGVTAVMSAYQGMPFPILLVALLVVIYGFIATRTRFGRYVYAIGGNREAARFSGIPVERMTLLLFVISSSMAAIAGLVLTGRLAAATMQSGQGAELDAVAACVIGGISMGGGTGNVRMAIIGALVMASMDNGLSMMNTPAYWQFIVKGTILVLAVWIDIATKQRSARA